MESGNFLRDSIQRSKGVKFKTLQELAELAKVNQGNLSSFMKPEGDPKRRENMTFDTAWKILQFLGVSIPREDESVPTIHRMGTHAPVEIVEGDVLPRIPVVGEAGAGSPVDFFNQTPDRWIQVLPQYMLPNICAYQVTGDSMQPTIMKNSYVGVVPLDGSLAEGSVYLLKDEDFGYMVKRVRKDSTGIIMLHSDNKDYEPRPIQNTGYNDIIIGRVVWVWQLM